LATYNLICAAGAGQSRAAVPTLLTMARGWESKSVEQQQEEATSATQQRAKPLTARQIAESQKRKGLELSRQRILQQLEVASNPQHRSMLEAALAELNAQLKVTEQ
jgi:hypothetical protein